MGLRVKKCLFLGVWERTFGRKRRRIPGEMLKNSASGKLTVFEPFWSPWLTISCQKRSPCVDNFTLFLGFFFLIAHAIFIMFLASKHIHFLVFCCIISTSPLLSSSLLSCLTLPSSTQTHAHTQQTTHSTQRTHFSSECSDMHLQPTVILRVV